MRADSTQNMDNIDLSVYVCMSMHIENLSLSICMHVYIH